MTLEEATVRAAAALQAGDFEGVARALRARRAAIAAGEPPTAEAIEAGQRILDALLELQRQAALDSARLGQIQRYIQFHRP